MSRRSRGCLRCRQRRVKCDETRPACHRCVARDEACVGYRDDIDLVFLDQTSTVTLKAQSIQHPQPGGTRRSRSLRSMRPSQDVMYMRENQFESESTHGDLKSLGAQDPTESKFLDNHILQLCNSSSSFGFQEHLPSLFKDVNVQGRYALRWAAQAAEFAEMSTGSSAHNFTAKAVDCYGRSLLALGKSLSEKGKQPDDYDLLTMVLLDLFEDLYLPEHEIRPGTHAQAMAHILRLRGHAQFQSSRGWGLFRLAHHRLQREQLAKRLSPMPESQQWLSATSDDPFNQLETKALEISTVCDRARRLKRLLDSGSASSDELLQVVQEMRAIDGKASEWRKGSEWSFKEISKNAVSTYTEEASQFPERIEVHHDIWMAYEWNYHRTARIILHQQLIQVLEESECGYIAASESSNFTVAEVEDWIQTSRQSIQQLADQILSTVPQCLGELDNTGTYIPPDNRRLNSAVGAYLLLWPIRIIKSTEGKTTDNQQRRAQEVFERIRERTRMKSHLGNLSSI